MKIELKNIKHHAALSEETNAFSASLYIDGKKAGTAENTGKGGQTLVRDTKATRELVKIAEEYCKTLPPEKIKLGGRKYFEIPRTLDNEIDRLVEEDFNYRPLKSAMKKHVLVKDPDGSIIKIPVLAPVTKPRMAEAIRQLEARGDKVLNNLPVKDLLKEVYGG